MCGILIVVRGSKDVTNDLESVWDKLKEANSARGPDAQNCITLCLDLGQSPLDIRFFASELLLRGEKPVVQPHRSSGCVFCWNGEVFEGLELKSSDNDGVKLFESINPSRDPDQELRTILESIEGPYAFCYFHETSKRLYFGRDPLGRRSLLVHKPSQQKPYFILASVSSGLNPLYDFEEVGTERLYYIDLDQWAGTAGHLALQHGFRELPRSHKPGQCGGFSRPANVNRAMPASAPLFSSPTAIPPKVMHSVTLLLDELSRSVKLMVQDVPRIYNRDKARIAILFSGGIDCTVLAYLADKHVPLSEPIELLNVAFENPRKIRLRSDANEGPMKKKRGNEIRNGQSGKFDTYLVPDRMTGLEELAELRNVCPHRQWSFVEVDVTFEETTRYRRVVENIMHPCRTVMDLSLALALYFASRGVGHIRENGEIVPYTSSARVLINGLGSDELLGGYNRHRTAYSSGGWPAVIDELQMEIDRIPTRNLGRDDRIISSHGKEARHPFLSLSFVNRIASLPVHHKMDPRLELGLGDKMLLRIAARRLGLDLASSRKKRAMQFGSHSARMESGGSERRGDLLIS